MRINGFALSGIAAMCLATAGCERHYYMPPPPPPAYAPGPALAEQAQHNGFRVGENDGARDAVNGWGYRPTAERNYAETPGYDPQFGPLGPYQQFFRRAYLRGYDRGFHRG